MSPPFVIITDQRHDESIQIDAYYSPYDYVVRLIFYGVAVLRVVPTTGQHRVLMAVVLLGDFAGAACCISIILILRYCGAEEARCL